MKRLVPVLLLGIVLAARAWALSADEQMRFADGIYLRGFYETALTEYIALIRDNPGSPHEVAALYRIGECYRQLGNQAGAERFYKRVAQEFPQSPQAPRAELRRAEIAIADQQYAAAQAILTTLQTRDATPETAAAAGYYLGYSRLKNNDAAGADAAFRQVLADFADSPYASYAALDLAALHAKDKTPAAQMTTWYEQAVAAAPTLAAKAEALFRWGDWAYRNEDYQQAADTLQALLLELPDQPRARDAWLAAGWSLYFLERTPEAMELAEKLAHDAPDANLAAAGVYLRANCLRKLNRDGEALADYETVVRDYPRTDYAARAAYEIMVTRFKRGEYDKVLVVAPVQPAKEQAADVLWMRAEAERNLGRLDDARGHYEALVKEFPRAAQAVPALLRLGEMARAAGRQSEAAAWFQRVAQDYPKNEAAAEALKAAALANLRAGDPKAALAGWDDLLARSPTGAAAAEARLQKALVLIELKKPKDALALLDALVADAPAGASIAAAQYWRGVLLAEQEKWSAAEAALRACLAAGPEPQTASLARLRLAVALQRLQRLDEAADQLAPLLAQPDMVADNPALIEWLIRRSFEQGDDARALEAATALAQHAREASWRQIGWHWAGTSQTQLGREKEALASYRKAVAEPARTREGTEAQLLLAELELKNGAHEKAEAAFTAAGEAAAGEDTLDLRARAYFGLAETAEAAGQLDKAARHFMSVAVLYDDPQWTPQSLYRASQLFGKLGKKAEQESTRRELLQRYPDSSFARQLQEAAP